MALPDDLNIQEESSNLGGIPGMSNNSPDQFEYVPAEEFFTTPMTDEFDKALDPEIQNTLTAMAERVNKFAIPPIGNLNTPFPTEATGTYNPQAQQTPIDLSTPEGAQRQLDALASSSVDLSGVAPEKPFIADPQYTSRKASRFDRYYHHPEFAKLGFNPYANNEEFYNANSDIFDDMSRMFGVWGSQVGSGFMSNYRSIEDLTQDGSYFTNPDLLTAMEFEEALDIGMTSREGGLAFTNNMLLQTGYTFGIIGSIAVEEIALAGLEAVTFGGASGLLIGRSAFNLGRLGKTLGNTFDITRLAKASRNMLKTFNKADDARDFWTATKAGRKFATDLFAPETAAAFRNLKTMQHAGQDLTNLGKAAKTFGAFYKDLRSLNLALAESKLEAGMVFNTQIGNGMASYEARGLEVDAKAMEDITESANQASFHTVIRNAPLIFFTNQFILGNALPGFNRTMSRVMGDSVKGAGKRIIQTAKTIGKDGKVVKNVFKKTDEGLFGIKGFTQRVKAAGARGSALGVGQASLRYFAANVSEGIQELGQEAIAVGTKNYWTGLLEDPMAGGIELHRASVASAVDSQMGAQGFETFMSGFLMGGIVQGPQKIFFQGVPALYNRAKSSKDFKEYKENREKMIDSIVKTHNEAWNRMADSMDNTLWDSTKMNFLVQKEVAKDMEKAQSEDNMFGFMDAKDFGKFHHMATIFENGTSGLFRGQLKDLLQLTDEELLQAFPNVPKSEAKSGKVRQRLENMIVEMDNFEDRYTKNKNNNPNKFRPNDFKPGTREYQDEYLKYTAYEHARYLSMFTGESFNRALERADSIYNELASDPILSKIAANDLTVLLSLDSIDSELKLLAEEIVTIEDKKIKADKMNRMAKLEAIRQVLYAEENLNKDKTFRKSKNSTKEQKIATLETELENKLADANTNPKLSDKEKTEETNKIKAEYAKKIANVRRGNRTEKVDYPLTKLRKVLLDYVQYLAESKDSFVDNDRIEDVLKMIVDYRALKDRAGVYYKSIEYLANPARLDEIAQRQYEADLIRLKNGKKAYQELIDKYTLTVEQNALLNAFGNLTPAVFVEPKEVYLFLETGNADSLQTFYTDSDQVTKDNMPELFGEIQFIIGQYRDNVQRDEAKEEEAEETSTNVDADVETLFEGVDIDNAPNNKTQTSKKQENPEVKKLLEKMHRAYNASQVQVGKAPVKFETFIQGKQARTITGVYENLKKMWWNDVLAKMPDATAANEMYKNDEGFISWLKTQEEQPTVYNALNQAGLDFSDFYEVEGEAAEELTEDQINEIVDNEKLGGPLLNLKGKTYLGKTYAIIVIKRLEDNKTIKTYKVVRKDGKPLSDDLIKKYNIKLEGISLEKGSAIELYDKLEAVNTGNTFEFGGLTLSYGATVTDSKGNKYVVVSNAEMVGKNNNIMLVPEDIFKSGNKDKIKKAKSKYYTAKEIEAFKAEEFNFNVLSNNVTKLRSDEPLKAQPYENKEQNESRESAQERMDAVFGILTEEEINQLEIVVTENEDGGVVGENMKYESKEENPYIKKRTQPYSIAVRITDPNLLQTINKKLEAEGIPLMTVESNGVIAFLPNYDTVIEIDGQVIDPRFITIDQVKNTFFKVSNITDQQFVNNIQQNYGMAAAFLSFIEKNKKKGEPLSLKLSELEGYSLKADSIFNPSSSARKATELKYNTVDGNIVIFDNRVKIIDGKSLGRQREFITDVSNPGAKAALRKKVEQEMEDVMYEKARNAGAYVLVIKNSLGEYTYTDLKAASLTEEVRTELFMTLYNRAVKTINENLNVEGENYAKAEVKDSSFNVEWNQEFQQGFYISLNPGYTMDLKVNLAGKIEIQVFDNVSGKRLLVNDKGVSKPIVVTEEQIIKKYTEKDVEKGVLEQEIIKAINSDERLKKALPAEFNENNFRKSFATDTLAQAIINTTETTLDPRVRFNYKLRVNAPADMTQAAVDVPAQTTTSASQKVDDSDQNLADKLSEISENSEEIEKQSNHSARIAELKNLIELRKKEIITEFQKLSSTEKKNNPLGTTIANDSTIKGFQSELDQLNKLANKIVDPAMTYNDIVDIDAFKEWAKINLPDFISVKDIQVLGNNLLRGGVRVGAFGLALNSIAGGLDVEGTIYTGANNPFKYHEAFHAVFRLLLTDEQIDKYTGLAKKEVRALLRSEKGYEVLPGVFTNSLAEAREILRNSAEDYAEMSDSRIEQELYEEYMANEFELFKKNRKSSKTDSTIKSFFNKVLEWIKSFFTSYSKNELTKLYENIDAGKFKSSEAVVNKFTNSHVKGVTVANALIPYERIEGSRTEGFLFLDGNQSRQLVNNASAIYVNRLQTKPLEGKSRKDILDEVIDDFANLYSTSNSVNYDLTTEQFMELLKYEEAFRNYRDKIAEAVSTNLELVDVSIDEKQFTEEEIEDEQGLRNTQEWDKDASLTGGFSSLSSKLRKYIMTTTLPVSQTDAGSNIFGHTELTEGEPLINAVDFSAAYNGLLKATANTTDANVMLQKMYLFAQNNPETEAVVIKFFTDIGILKSEIDVDPSTQLDNLMSNIIDLKGEVTRPLFFNAMIKGFQNFRIDYLFIHRNIADGTVYTYSAALRDDANSQIDIWAQHYSDIFSTKLEKDPKAKEDAVAALTALKDYISGETITPEKGNKYSYGKTQEEADANLNEEVRELSKNLRKYLGITLSPQYIAYNVIQRLSDPTNMQRIIAESNEDVRMLTGEDVEIMINIVGNDLNLFGDKEGATTKLKELSMGNSVFDETIGTSVFKNPNGDLVYAHQLPTFHLQAIQELNDPRYLEAKKTSDDYLMNNLLLNSEAFKSLSAEGRLQILRISGAKSGVIDVEGGDDITESANQQGKTYGDFTAKEFISNIINAYTANYNRAKVKNNGLITIENEDGSVTREALAPILIRVIEASNTGDMLGLPVIKAVIQDGGGIRLTDQAIQAYVNEIKAEFERIKTELNPETATYNTDTGEGTLFAGYNADKMGQKPDENGRAFTFAKTGSILKDNVERETFAKDAKAFTSADQLARVKEGNQKALVYTKEKANLVFSQMGSKRRTVISAKGQKVGFQTTLQNRGPITVTIDNIDEMLALFGDSVSNTETETHTKKFTIGKVERWAEGENLANFLSGKKELVLFEIQGGEIDKTETLEESRAEQSAQESSEVEKVTEEETYIPVNITKKNYTRTQVKNSPNTAFVFTENNHSITAFPNKQGKGSALIRPEENAFAIVTKKKYDYDTREDVDYADTEEDFAEFVEVNTRLINELKESGKSEIVFPKGFAIDKAEMPARFAEWLQGQLRDNFGLVTELNKAKTGLISKSVDDTVSKVIVQEEVVEELNDYESQLLAALEINSEVSFEDAIGNMDEFESFLQNRLNKEFLEFKKVLTQELGGEPTASFAISKDIREGLTNKAGESTDASKIAAKQLNLTTDPNFNLRQIFFNNWLNSSALNDVILGDQAVSLKDAVDAVKRAKMQNGSGYGADTIINAPKYGVEHAVDRMDMFLFTDPMAPSKYSKKDIEVADGQTYGTIKAFRYLWFGFGKLTLDQAKLLDKVAAGKNVSYEELLEQVDENTESYVKLKAMINSKKIVYGDGNVFQKTSLFTLTKGYTSKQVNGEWVAKAGREHLHNLRVKMEAYEEKMWEQGEGTLAFAAPTSASKMAKYNVSPLESIMDATTELTEANSMQLKAKYMRLQVINPSNKLIITDPTQIKSLVTSEHDDSAEVFIDGEKTDLGKVRAAYNKALIERGNLKYTNKRNVIFNFDAEYASELLKESVKEGELSPDLFVYLQYATEGLKASQATSNILEMFSTDENGNQKYNLNNPQTVRKFEELFLSFFSKGVFSEKTTGMSVALASDFGVGVIRRVFSVDENGIPDKHEIIRSDVYDSMENAPEIMYNINEGTIIGDDSNLEGLAAAVEQAGSEGVVIIDRLRSDMKEYDSKGNYTNQKYSESMIAAHHVSVGNELAKTDKAIPDVVSKMFGVRIPSQDNHSTINIKMVDFLPGEYGSTGIFPRELVEVSGADFDIDKLYIQTKKFYEENGQFFEYGKSETEDGQFSDYVRYVNESVGQPSTDMSEALMKFKYSGSIVGLTDSDKEKLKKDGFSNNAINALSATHLPKTKQEYLDHKLAYGEPYTYAIDNKTLDYKFALMGNESNTTAKGEEVPLSYEPADSEPLKKLFNELSDKDTGLEFFQKFNNEGGNSVDSPLGQVLAFKNNKEGAASIGAVVLPNLYLNMFQEYGVTVKKQTIGGETATKILRLNGMSFTDFATLREELPDGTKGERTQYIISALITAMTDNAKERMAAKLGLNKSSLAVIANMTALGVPFKTSVLMINNPLIKRLYYSANNKDKPTDPGIKKLVKDTIEELLLDIGGDENLTNYEVNDNLLIEQIDEPRSSESDPSKTINILQEFLTAIEIAEYTGKVSSIMNLSSGLGRDIRAIKDKIQDINDLGINLSEEGYKDYEKIRRDQKLPLIDIRPILKDTWQGANVKKLIEINDKILPAVFLSETKPFDFIYKKVSTSLNHDFKGITKDKLIMDLISYLTIKGYQYNQLNSETSTNKKYMGSLSTSYLYPQLEGEKISEVITRLKDVEAANGQGNFFLSRFAIAEASDEINNKDGIHKVNANTFNRISDSQKVELQTSFARLYLNFDTRDDALALVHYAMLKDGFQYGYQSILDAITPVVYDSFLGHINTIHRAFKGDAKNDKIFQGTFGLTFNELVQDFTDNYLKSARISTSRVAGTSFVKSVNYNTRFVGGVDKGVETSGFTFQEVKDNPDTIFIYPDNMLRSGYDGPRNVRALDNTIGLPITKDNLNSDTSKFRKDDLEVVQELTMQFKEEFDKKTEGKNIVFHTGLFTKEETKRLEKDASNVYEEFKGMLTTLGFDLEAGTIKSGTVTTKRGLKNKFTYIDETGPVAKFIVNLYPKVDAVKTEEDSAVRNPKGDLPKLSDKDRTRLRWTKLEVFNDKVVKNKYYRYALLPQAIVVSMGKGSANRYFVMTKVQNAGSNTPIAEQEQVQGNYAEYTEYIPVGSRAVNPIAFIGGEQPTYQEVKEYVANAQDPIDFAEIDDTDFDFLDAAIDAKANTIEKVSQDPNTTIEATNGKVDLNGKNMADITKEDVPETNEVDTDVELREQNVDTSAGDNVQEVDMEAAKKQEGAFGNLFGTSNTTPAEQQITDFYDNFIDKSSFPAVKKKYLKSLEDAGINSLEELIETFNETTKTADEFIEEVKECILKI